jgi:hypothetical protein
VIYVARGTKALVIDGAGGAGETRELNRSYYRADAYQYPVCPFRLPDGHEVIAHCPREYNRLEIEDLETGECLTARDYETRGVDVFHSRLAASPDGRRLLGAGWVWHPWGLLDVWDVEHALEDPTTLDEHHFSAVNGEVESACWLDDDRILVSVGMALDDEPEGEEDLLPGELGVWSTSASGWLARSRPPKQPGTLIAFGEHALALFEHPTLLDPYSGEVVEEWPDIQTGRQDSSIIWRRPLPPAFAADPANRRFAVADGTDVILVEDV